MKKKITLSIIICSVLLSTIVLAATNFTVKLESTQNSIKSGDTVEIALKLDDFSKDASGINVLLGTLEYDRTIFEEVTVKNLSPIQYWGTPTYNPVNGKLLLDANEFVNTAHNALKLTLTVKNTISENTSTKIKFKNIEASDGENDLKIDDALITFEVEKSNDNNVSDSENNNKTVIMIVAIAGVVILGTLGIILVKRKIK